MQTNPWMTTQLVEDHRQRLEAAAGAWRNGRQAVDPGRLAVRARTVPVRAKRRAGWWMVHAGLRLATVPTVEVASGSAALGCRPRPAPW
jgi:hypothetical protein